jgi:hypothetical protein
VCRSRVDELFICANRHRWYSDPSPLDRRASGSFESETQFRGEQDRSSDPLRPATSNCTRGLIWPAVGTTIPFRDILLSCSWQLPGVGLSSPCRLLFLCDPFASVVRSIEEATVDLTCCGSHLPRCESSNAVTRVSSMKPPGIPTNVILPRHKSRSMPVSRQPTTLKAEPRFSRNASPLSVAGETQGNEIASSPRN